MKRRITRKWKVRLEKGLLVFTTDPKSPTHQKRLIRGEKDFALAIANGFTETDALEKAFSNAAGGTNAKYNAALAAAYKASPAKNVVNKAAATGKTYFSKLGQAIKGASTSCWLLLIAVVTYLMCTSLAVGPVEWLKWSFWAMVVSAIFLVLILEPRKLFKFFVFTCLIVAVIAVFAAFAPHNPTAPNGTNSTTTTTPTNEKTDPVTGLLIIDGGDPTNPINGTASNADSRTPVVRDGSIVSNWAGLDALLGTDTYYTKSVSKTTGINWNSDVPKFKSTESAGNDPRFILAVNTTASDEVIRKIASDSIGEDLSGLKILRVDSIVNTRGFTKGDCQEFLDRRSMVRVTLGKFVYGKDGSVIGLQYDIGVFVDCHNPWRLPTPTPTPTSTPTSKPTSTPTLQPKSTNPDDYKKPGDGTEADSGTGIKPPVPTVTTPAESNPPTVITATPTEPIVAPSAKPAPTKAPSSTVTPTPTNPIITGDPGNPFK